MCGGLPVPASTSTIRLYRPEALPFVAEGRTWSPGMIAVTRPVYASTTVTAVNLDSSRAKDSNPQPCYPDCCFAVDNFDNTFEDLVRQRGFGAGAVTLCQQPSFCLFVIPRIHIGPQQSPQASLAAAAVQNLVTTDAK